MVPAGSRRAEGRVGGIRRMPGEGRCRVVRLLACLILQVAFLFAVSPASASVEPPCHHQVHGAAAGSVPARHAEADHHPSSPAADHCGRCMACCLGGACTAAWRTPAGSTAVAATLFRTVRFTHAPGRWSVGQTALPALPPPRRIA